MGTVNPLLTQAESSHTGMLAPAPVPLLKAAAVESMSPLPLSSHITNHETLYQRTSAGGWWGACEGATPSHRRDLKAVDRE